MRIVKVVLYGISLFLMTVIISRGSYAGTAPEKGGAAGIKKLNIAILCESPIDEPYTSSLVQSLERVKKEKPHGIDINWDVLENIYLPDSGRVFRSLAKAGKYDVIWGHSPYTPAIKDIYKKYPNILWVVAGSGNEALGNNFLWVDMQVNESAYLLGMLAGLMTKSNVISAVAGYPTPDVNHAINGFFDGAKAVNPDIKYVITYIESWFDPPKAREAALAQIAVGSDYIYAERFGPFTAAKEKGVFAIGQYRDQADMAPEVVVSSPLALWDQVVKYIVEQVWIHKTTGQPYQEPLEKVIYNMKEGGTDIAPFHAFDSKIPPEVKGKIMKARQDILDGKLVIPYRPEPVTSSR